MNLKCLQRSVVDQITVGDRNVRGGGQHTFNTFVGGKLLVLELLSLFCCGNFVGATTNEA